MTRFLLKLQNEDTQRTLVDLRPSLPSYLGPGWGVVLGSGQ